MNRSIEVLLYILFALFPLGYLARMKLSTNIYLLPQDVIVFAIFAICCALYYKKFVSLEFKMFYFFQSLFILTGAISLLLNALIFSDVSLQTALLYTLRYVFYLSLLSVTPFLAHKVNIKKVIYMSGYTTLLIGFFQFSFFNNLKPLFYLGWDDHLYRLFSSFLDPNFAGVFYVLFFLLLLYEVATNKLRYVYIHIIGLFFTLIAIYLTYSRTALVALIGGVLVFAIYKRKLKLLLGGMVVFITLLAIVSETTIEGLNPFRTVSSSNRIVTMRQTIEIIQTSPLIGIGFNSFRDAQIRHGVRNEIGAARSNSDGTTDNSSLFILATTGVIGFLFYLLSLYFLIRKLLDEKLAFNKALIAMLVCLGLASIFLNVLFYTPILLWLMLIIAFRKKLA